MPSSEVEVPGAAISVVRTVNVRIQIHHVLQKQIDDVQNADLRLLQTVSKLGYGD